MATHDYVISNASGAAVRADLNNALAAIVSNNSNATEPSTTYSYMLWADTGSSPPVMKLRNAANDGWVTLFQLDGTLDGTLAVEDGTAAAPSIYFKESGTDTGLFSSGTDEVAITTGGTQRATIDSSGRLLVGTSSATTGSLLAVAGGDIIIRKDSGGDEVGVDTYKYRLATQSGVLAEVFATSEGSGGASGRGGALKFFTKGDNQGSTTERMRIDNDGGILQTSSNNAGFTVSNNSTGNVGTLIGVSTATTAGTGFNFILCWSSSFTSERFKVQGNGDTRNANNVFGGISDIKLKENIVSSGSQWNDLKALQVRKYNFKEGETHTQIGLIAQEVELVSPGLVAETPDRDKDGNDLGTTTKSVNYSVLYMKAVKALQEAMERIEVLEQRLTDAGIA